MALTLFLAVVLHVLIILGVGFDHLLQQQQEPPPITLDVTRVDDPGPPVTPEPVEHIASHDQAGSGATPENRDATTPEPIGARVGDTAPLGDGGTLSEPVTPRLQPSEVVIDRQPDPVASTAPTAEPRPQHREPSPTDTVTPPETPSAAMLMARGLEAVRAAPAPAEHTRTARATRTGYLDTLSARAAPEAAYLEAWIRKVERIGNLNYPDEARRQALAGSLVLSVRLDSQGQVLNVAVTRSSGEAVLDQAAVRIVELAAPFSPFTESMRERYDELVITRTWAFQRDRVQRAR